MVDFNNDIPKGKPQLPKDYWTKFANHEKQNSLSDVNTNFALKDLSEISLFIPKK